MLSVYRLLQTKDNKHVCSECSRHIDKNFHYLLWSQKIHCLNCGLVVLINHKEYYEKSIKEINGVAILIQQFQKERVVQKLKGGSN